MNKPMDAQVDTYNLLALTVALNRYEKESQYLTVYRSSHNLGNAEPIQTPVIWMTAVWGG
jgi:hypothetical protein